MPHYPVPLLSILVFLTSAAIMIYTTRRLRLSPTLGYLFAGILIGPYCFALVETTKTVRLLGEIGVLFLLFKVGLELPIHRLQALRTYVFGLGSAQVILTTIALGWPLSYFYGFSFSISCFVGCTLALSSTALIIQLLSERSELTSRFGRVAFAILLFQDLAVILLFIMMTFQGTIGTPDNNLIWTLLKMLGGAIVFVMIARFLIEPLFHTISAVRYPDLFTAGIFITCFGMCYWACTFGLPIELGAFVAGLSLSETIYRHQIEADIRPFQGLLLGFFFIIIGLEINLNILFENISFFCTFLFGIIAVKTLILFFSARLFKLSSIISLRLGLLLSGCGEFVFIVFAHKEIQQWVGSETIQLLFTLTAVSMVLTPFLAMLGTAIAKKFTVAPESRQNPLLSLSEIPDLKNHVIIAGFGRVGKMIGEILSQNMVPYLAVDYDMECVRKTRENPYKYPIIHADARDMELLKSFEIAKARVIIITFPQIATCIEIIHNLQENYPNLEICVRVQDHEHARKLAGTGVHLAIPETVESGLQLASMTLQAIGFSPDHIEKALGFVHRSPYITKPSFFFNSRSR